MHISFSMCSDSLDSPLLSAWYREIVEASEEVSKILPIRADTYSKFDQTEAVRERLSKRETLLQKYLDTEVAGQQ